jgi:hypothetical protein
MGGGREKEGSGCDFLSLILPKYGTYAKRQHTFMTPPIENGREGGRRKGVGVMDWR